MRERLKSRRRVSLSARRGAGPRRCGEPLELEERLAELRLRL